mgnify:CR=1 FL=1
MESLYDNPYDGHTAGDLEIEFVAFSGGGMTGMSFVGVLESLHKHELYMGKHAVKYWAGSSAGAICAALAAMNTPIETINELKYTDTRKLVSPGLKSFFINSLAALSSIWLTWGVASRSGIVAWLEMVFVKLGYSPGLTFAELYTLTGNYLTITATSLLKKDTLYFNRLRSPDMRIIDAVEMSINIPLVFNRYSWDGDFIIDGGITNGLPLNVYDVVEDDVVMFYNRKAVGFNIHNASGSTPITSLTGYIMGFIHTMLARLHAHKKAEQYYKDRVVDINIDNMTSLDFTPDKDVIDRLCEKGYSVCEEFINKRDGDIQKKRLPTGLFIPSYKSRCLGVVPKDSDIGKTVLYSR